MRLEAVVICDGYADFLAHTLPRNRNQFDRMVIVTSPEDEDTQRLATYHHCQVVATDALNTRWGEFHKAKGINVGLAELKLDDWVVHLDADIVLPPRAKDLMGRADLDPACIYGCDRFMLRGTDEWERHVLEPTPLHDQNIYLHLDQPWPLGTRFWRYDYGGFIPIGFFQLWHPATSGHYGYPDDHSDAGRTDMLFAAQWPRRKRQLLPEVVVYHLESADASGGSNWNGRVTAPFTTVPEIAERKAPHRHPKPVQGRRHHHHHHHHHHPPYTG